jgi:hypothetical protein
LTIKAAVRVGKSNFEDVDVTNGSALPPDSGLRAHGIGYCKQGMPRCTFILQGFCKVAQFLHFVLQACKSLEVSDGEQCRSSTIGPASSRRTI